MRRSRILLAVVLVAIAAVVVSCASRRHELNKRWRRGRFHWDCSGMAAWILRRAAPVAHPFERTSVVPSATASRRTGEEVTQLRMFAV